MTAVHPLQTIPAAATDRPIVPFKPDGALRPLNVRFGVEDGNDVALGHVHRPTWRGGIHVMGLVAAIPAVSALILASTGDTRLRLGLVAYAMGLVTMFGASATYHRWVHGLRARSVSAARRPCRDLRRDRRIGTPIVLTAFPGATGLILVAAIWSAGLIGAWWKLSRWSGGDRAGTAMYAVTTPLAAVAVPWLWVREGVDPAVFVVAGGAVYLIGAAGFARQWPTLRPAVFSYHEVWHVFTVIAAMAQFVAIWMLAT